ncbi:hypothetical protein ZIOFF_024567 [Zingiber officinale]|uniref:Piwi domain-containing protein n=1 Tax=Zingiber officinale TaxID=94328 RepID=A0A8J5GSM4_ZINOF|nr:hypothetical protein ZIOFF_024567 [Zingiber officinale]
MQARNNAPKLWLSRYTIFYHGIWQMLKEPKGKIKSPILLYWHGKPRSCLLKFPQRHDARPSSCARLSTHWRNPSKVQTNPSVGSCTWDPVSAFSSFAFVDWVKVTDGEFFQTDSRPIMPFDGVCNFCNGGVRFVRDNDRNRSHGPLRFLLRFPPDGTRRFRVNLVVNAIKSQPKLLNKIDEVVSHFLNIVQTMHERCSSSLEVDIIALDFSQKLPFRLKIPSIKLAIQVLVDYIFEITYSHLIVDSHVTRKILSDAKTCASLEPNYQPPVTFVVVQKCHHTRLFANNHGDHQFVDKSGNILPELSILEIPGTVVDSKIGHPTELDFYLCSYASIQFASQKSRMLEKVDMEESASEKEESKEILQVEDFNGA